MKFSILVSLVAFATIASTMQAASAQESRGARFNFAPNVWKSESVRLPKGYGGPEPMHNVRPGAVPSNLLGVDPSMLAKPAPPPIVAVQPAMPMVSAQMSVPRANASFNPIFGKPQVAPMPATVPQQAVAMPMTTKPVVAKAAPAARRQVATGVQGVLRKPPSGRPTNITPMSGTPAVASYKEGFGYSPGLLLPSNSSGGSRTTTAVSGVIVGKKHK
jgi:hypothetical protein